MSKYTVALILAGAAICLTACGMKGSLELPPGPPPEPLLGNRKPAPKPAPTKPADAASKDGSTDKNPSSQ